MPGDDETCDKLKRARNIGKTVAFCANVVTGVAFEKYS
jgi:hypothetical protein